LIGASKATERYRAGGDRFWAAPSALNRMEQDTSRSTGGATLAVEEHAMGRTDSGIERSPAATECRSGDPPAISPWLLFRGHYISWKLYLIQRESVRPLSPDNKRRLFTTSSPSGDGRRPRTYAPAQGICPRGRLELSSPKHGMPGPALGHRADRTCSPSGGH